MEVLILLIFVSLLLAGAAVGLFVWLAGQRTFEHGDRLELLPLDDGDRRGAHRYTAPPAPDQNDPSERASQREET